MPVSLPSIISRAWPRKPKPVTSVQAWTSDRLRHQFRRLPVEGRHSGDGAGNQRRIGKAALEGRADDPRAERFGQDQPIPGFSARC